MKNNSIGTQLLFALKDFMPKSFKSFLRNSYPERFRTQDWSEIELDILQFLVIRNRGAFDVGANSGDYTEKLSVICEFVTAFEPDVGLAAEVEARQYPGVRVLNCALSVAKGIMTYHIPVVDGKPDIATATLRTENLNGVIIKRTVETLTLDEFSDVDVGFIKIDVEGHEQEVLEGGRAFFAKQRPNVLIEAEDSHRAGAPAKVRSFFEDLGYCGIFIFGKKTYPIADLTADMSDARHISRPIPRKDMPYVNNFMFFPTQALADKGRVEIDRFLNGTA